ncbi:hypothetical protein N9F11_00340 [Akkermansiaceae bacterium]|nr:hypothetical protein [Akkermansiaceae bacterium]
MGIGYWLSNGLKVLWSVLIFSYGLQLLLFYFVSDEPVIWNFSRPNFSFYASLIVFFGCFILFTFRAIHLKKLGLVSKILLKVSVSLSKVLSLFWFKYRFLHVYLYLVVGVYWLGAGLAHYRYDGIAISDKLSVEILIGMLWKVFFIADFWFHVILRVLGKKNHKYKHKRLINFTFLLTLTGTTSVVYFVVHSTFVYFPKFFIRILKISIRDVIFRNKVVLIRIVLFIPIALVLASTAFHYGELIKTKNEQTFVDRFSSSESLASIKRFLVQRTSTTLYGHTYLWGQEDLGLSDYKNNLKIPFSNFLYRADILCGRPFGVSKPEIASINRLNYTTISAIEPDKTSGASPGLIPGFLYIFPSWLAIIVAAYVLSKVAILINLCISDLTFITVSFTVFIFLDLTKAVILVLNPLDQVFFFFLFFLGLNGILYRVKKGRFSF